MFSRKMRVRLSMRMRAQSNESAKITDGGEERRHQQRDNEHHREKRDKPAPRSLAVSNYLLADFL
jgi:hypothetical protein